MKMLEGNPLSIALFAIPYCRDLPTATRPTLYAPQRWTTSRGRYEKEITKFGVRRHPPAERLASELDQIVLKGCWARG